jgi:hypothetical protein
MYSTEYLHVLSTCIPSPFDGRARLGRKLGIVLQGMTYSKVHREVGVCYYVGASTRDIFPFSWMAKTNRGRITQRRCGGHR